MLGWTNNGYSDAAIFQFTSVNATAAGLPPSTVDFAEFTYTTVVFGNTTCRVSRNTGTQSASCTFPGGIYTSQTNPYSGVTTLYLSSPDMGLTTPLQMVVNPDHSWSSTLPNGTVISGPDVATIPRPPSFSSFTRQPESVFLDWNTISTSPSLSGLAGWVAKFACSCDDTNMADLCQHEIVQIEAVITVACVGLGSICWAAVAVPAIAAVCGVSVGVCTMVVGVLMYICAKRFNPCPPEQCKPLCRGPSSDYDFCDNDYPN